MPDYTSRSAKRQSKTDTDQSHDARHAQAVRELLGLFANPNGKVSLDSRIVEWLGYSAGALLHLLLHWAPYHTTPDGFVAKSVEMIMDEAHVQEGEARYAIEKLVIHNLVERDVRAFGGKACLHFRINTATIAEKFRAFETWKKEQMSRAQAQKAARISRQKLRRQEERETGKTAFHDDHTTIEQSVDSADGQQTTPAAAQLSLFDPWPEGPTVDPSSPPPTDPAIIHLLTGRGFDEADAAALAPFATSAERVHDVIGYADRQQAAGKIKTSWQRFVAGYLRGGHPIPPKTINQEFDGHAKKQDARNELAPSVERPAPARLN